MKNVFASIKAIVALSVIFGALLFSMGCSTVLAPAGVYHGDKILYNSEKIIVTAYKNFDRFLKWEEMYRAVLPVDVSRTADVIRLNARQWISSAQAFHDAYVTDPSAVNKDKMLMAINLIDVALSEASKYIQANKSKAPISVQ